MAGPTDGPGADMPAQTDPVPEPVDYFAPIAHLYETYWPELFDPAVIEPAVRFLAEHAGDGPALELGVGTGRLALPLHSAGVPVHGIELSPAVVEQLRTRPGSQELDITIGDMATTRVEQIFTLVYLVRNTIMNLTTQDAQVACFANAAAHLEPGGCFVMEVMVPQLRRLPPGETVRPFTMTTSHLGFDEVTDFVAQESWSHHYWIVDGALHTFSAPFRYVWPSELDLMARLAGLVLRERWGDWDRSPFTSESTSHVSVWQREAHSERA